MARQSKKPADPTQGVGQPLAKTKRRQKSHGGSRVNSGRKSHESLKAIAEVNAATMARLADWIPGLFDNLKKLADGGYQRIEDKYDPEMKLIERKVSWADCDRRANEYLIDRYMGKPTERQELSGPDGGLIPVAFEHAAEKVWADDDDHIQPD